MAEERRPRPVRPNRQEDKGTTVLHIVSFPLTAARVSHPCSPERRRHDAHTPLRDVEGRRDVKLHMGILGEAPRRHKTSAAVRDKMTRFSLQLCCDLDSRFDDRHRAGQVSRSRIRQISRCKPSYNSISHIFVSISVLFCSVLFLDFIYLPYGRKGIFNLPQVSCLVHSKRSRRPTAARFQRGLLHARALWRCCAGSRLSLLSLSPSPVPTLTRRPPLLC